MSDTAELDTEKMQEISEKLQRMSRRISSSFESFAEASEENVEDLARMGWTLPLRATPKEVREIYDLETTDEVDDYFLNEYRKGSDRYQSLKEHLLSNENLERWRPLIHESFRAFERGDYKITVPALISVLEGLVEDMTGRLQDSPNPKHAVRHKRQTESGDVKNWIALSIEKFVWEVFEQHSFSGETPDLINRHWILHGRDHTDWSKVDTLRLFQAIQTVSVAW